MATRKGRLFRDCLNQSYCTAYGGNVSGVAPYVSQMVNNITVYGRATEQTPPDFIINVLAEDGGIAYIKNLNRWARFYTASAKRVNGLPTVVRLWSDERQQWSGDTPVDDNIHIYPANAMFFAVVNKIAEYVQTDTTIDENISQNLANLRELTAICVYGNALKNQLEEANDKRLKGATHVVINLERRHKNWQAAGLKPDDELGVVTLSPNAHNYLPDYLELKKNNLEELNKVIGISNVAEKEERRINSEMVLINNSSMAYIDMIINTINKYAKYYGDDIHAHRTHSGCDEHIDEAIDESPAEGEIINEEGTDNGEAD